MKPILVCLSLALSLAAVLFAQDLSGTYTGTLTSTGADGPRGEATIVIKQEGSTLNITAGPQPDKQRPVSKISRDGDSLKFEIVPPESDASSLITFAVVVKDGKLTGKLTMTRGEESRTGELQLVKQ